MLSRLLAVSVAITHGLLELRLRGRIIVLTAALDVAEESLLEEGVIRLCHKLPQLQMMHHSTYYQKL